MDDIGILMYRISVGAISVSKQSGIVIFDCSLVSFWLFRYVIVFHCYC